MLYSINLKNDSKEVYTLFWVKIEKSMVIHTGKVIPHICTIIKEIYWSLHNYKNQITLCNNQFFGITSN